MHNLPGENIPIANQQTGEGSAFAHLPVYVVYSSQVISVPDEYFALSHTACCIHSTVDVKTPTFARQHSTINNNNNNSRIRARILVYL